MWDFFFFYKNKKIIEKCVHFFNYFLYLCSILITTKNQAIMKGQIHLDGQIIFKSNRISGEKLEKMATKLFEEAGCYTMKDRVKRNARIFRSY